MGKIIYLANDLSQIPDQLHEKLSLGLLGRVAIVRLDWELDEGVPATEMDNFLISEMDNF